MSSSWFGKLTGEKEKHSSKLRWMERNWDTIVCLIGIFIIALTIRAYFAYDIATKFGTPYLLGGGSDSHYNARIINYILQNKEHLGTDPLRGYPLPGKPNVRPPLYQWSIVLGGHLLAPFVGNLDKGVQLSFILSSGFWGALTIFPVYLIGKETFGKKAGIAGAFLLAISAGHLERGVITNTNHDALSLFLVVTAFFFFMRSLEELSGDRKWVSNWAKLNKIKKGLSEFFGSNKRALLYAAMTGMAIGTVALTWKGYAYAVVIILVYFLIQLIIDKFREQDSLGITVAIFIMMMIAFLVILPWYGRNGILTKLNIFQGSLGRYYQIPLVIFLGAFGVGVYFTVTRDLPWVLSYSILAIAGVLFFTLGPNVIQSAAGQYFIENKLYSTIAEAQAPQFSRLVLAGGIVTFFLSWAGIGLAIWHVMGEWDR
ncbi:MAG: glycosyltransferase family 39 protein, partial [Candidatus Thermoplasmatota archaeon]|nr:glycosyltransferase family 39 protein [Candidatus Thermoplasmatota archaeon]